VDVVVEYPVEALRVSGRLPEDRHKVIPLSEAREAGYLKVERGKLYLNIIGSRSFLDYEKYDVHGRRSDYYEDFYQGASIVPQPCWFVDVVDPSDPRIVVVQTSRRAEARGKVKVHVGSLPVEREFVYGVLTSAEVLPFQHLKPNTAVLPIVPAPNGFKLLRREEAKQQGYPHLAEWLRKVEEVWDRVRGEKREKIDIYGQINYQRSLTGQNPRKKYKVVYLRSGTHLASSVVVNEPVNAGGYTLNGIVIESTLYRFETDNREEAFYLAAVLNSSVLDELIKPLQSRGAFGERHISKKPLEFPIPKYDPGNALHRRLSELGEQATKRASSQLRDILASLKYDAKLEQRGFLTPQEVGRLRAALREALADIIREIDSLTVELLKTAVREKGKKAGLLKFLKANKSD
jgi:hypothetical protein